MSRRQEPWTGKDTAQCFGMVALMAGGLTACTGHLSIDYIRVYADTAGDAVAAYALPVAASAGGIFLAVGVLLLVVRHLRASMAAALRNQWLYRRRWASVLADLELVVTGPAGTKVPQLRSVVRVGDDDVLSVQMVRGQSAALWHERSAELAREFGAASARVRFGSDPHRDIEIVISRTNRPAPRREQLALPAPQPHPIPLALPVQPQREPVARPREQQTAPKVAVRISGIRLQIVWAIARPHEKNVGNRSRLPRRQRFGVRGEMRWQTAWAAI